MSNGVKFFRLSPQSGAEPLDGVTMRGVIGDHGMLNLITLEPDSIVPEHNHPHEQLGIILKGVQYLEVEGVEHRLEALDAYVLPGGVMHAGRGGPEGCLSIDIFFPVRDDYRSAAAEEIDATELVERG